jgi:hypothetical protein
MIQFLFGLMLGFIIGYPMGLWAIDYTRRFNERQEHARTDQ